MFIKYDLTIELGSLTIESVNRNPFSQPHRASAIRSLINAYLLKEK